MYCPCCIQNCRNRAEGCQARLGFPSFLRTFLRFPVKTDKHFYPWNRRRSLSEKPVCSLRDLSHDPSGTYSEVRLLSAVPVPYLS